MDKFFFKLSDAGMMDDAIVAGGPHILKTSTPRYRNIEIFESMSANKNRLLVSSSSKQPTAVAASMAATASTPSSPVASKTYSDKSISTCDDKSSQTDEFMLDSTTSPTSHVSSGSTKKQQYGSRDSGITTTSASLDQSSSNNTTGELAAVSHLSTYSPLLKQSPAMSGTKVPIATTTTSTSPVVAFKKSQQQQYKSSTSKSLPQVNIA